ncbi:hypothetical protein M3P05_17080 [Sansalvadorimonas sp. 2012CJ34-2]|uniref:Uncharacterized protein n=1 Tax=Parendozoicomonas callyspongiae TaxID=2942213 RepID=A0ABT0PME3_9GAMM|nr:hypothetical protein [Sansalvadorimonas sp. 2012CJ34-2]MCL6271633.1 hypothetical protein [Sansalvadorimonas sp. 2012CJ34-2]
MKTPVFLRLLTLAVFLCITLKSGVTFSSPKGKGRAPTRPSESVSTTNDHEQVAPSSSKKLLFDDSRDIRKIGLNTLKAVSQPRIKQDGDWQLDLGKYHSSSKHLITLRRQNRTLLTSATYFADPENKTRGGKCNRYISEAFPISVHNTTPDYNLFLCVEYVTELLEYNNQRSVSPILHTLRLTVYATPVSDGLKTFLNERNRQLTLKFIFTRANQSDTKKPTIRLIVTPESILFTEKNRERSDRKAYLKRSPNNYAIYNIPLTPDHRSTIAYCNQELDERLQKADTKLDIAGELDGVRSVFREDETFPGFFPVINTSLITAFTLHYMKLSEDETDQFYTIFKIVDMSGLSLLNDDREPLVWIIRKGSSLYGRRDFLELYDSNFLYYNRSEEVIYEKTITAPDSVKPEVAVSTTSKGQQSAPPPQAPSVESKTNNLKKPLTFPANLLLACYGMVRQVGKLILKAIPDWVSPRETDWQIDLKKYLCSSKHLITLRKDNGMILTRATYLADPDNKRKEGKLNRYISEGIPITVHSNPFFLFLATEYATEHLEFNQPKSIHYSSSMLKTLRLTVYATPTSEGLNPYLNQGNCQIAFDFNFTRANHTTSNTPTYMLKVRPQNIYYIKHNASLTAGRTGQSKRYTTYKVPLATAHADAIIKHNIQYDAFLFSGKPFLAFRYFDRQPSKIRANEKQPGFFPVINVNMITALTTHYMKLSDIHEIDKFIINIIDENGVAKPPFDQEPLIWLVGHQIDYSTGKLQYHMYLNDTKQPVLFEREATDPDSLNTE